MRRRKNCIALNIILLLAIFSTNTNLRETRADISPTVWIVAQDGTGNFTTINGAIQDEKVSSGDTIFVRSGTYPENIVINKSISLIGENPNTTIIAGDGIANVISLNHISNVKIVNFTIRGSGLHLPDSAGIYAKSVKWLIIENNKIISNNHGIYLHRVSNSLIFGNIINNNSLAGIFSVSLHNSYIINNIFMGNSNGVVLYFSANNLFFGNTIKDNALEGMYLESSSDNTIYQNNFQNLAQVWCNMANFWDFEGEGNYWSDYNGSDFYMGFYKNETGSDGIGDEPYFINADNQDNFPLMGPFYAYDVRVGSKHYQVTLISNSTISNFSFRIGEETGNKILRFDIVSGGGVIGFCRVSFPTSFMGYDPIVLVNGEEVVPTFLSSQEAYRRIYFTYNCSSCIITIISSKWLSLYNQLLESFSVLNASYFDLLSNLSSLLGGYVQLQGNYTSLYELYRELLQRHNESLQNLRNLTYAFLAATTLFIIVIVYLSRRAHMTRLSANVDVNKTG